MRALAMSLALLMLAGGTRAETHVVTIEGMAFKPALLKVKRGDTVVWENRDIVPHTATAAGVFDSKAVAGGARWSWQAQAAGRHAYVCTFHPGMSAAVVVE